MSSTNTDHELLWWVDEADRPLGHCKRAEAHRLGLRHRAVHVLVFNPAGDIFLQRRSMVKDINPGLWDTAAAGHVNFGESYEDCAARELAEELGIEAGGPLRALFTLAAGPGTGWEFIRVFSLVHSGPFRLDPVEIDDGQWFALPALENWIASGGQGLTGSFQVLWRHYQARHRPPATP